MDTIAQRAGKTRTQAKSYEAKRGLRAATKRHTRHQAQLVAGLYFDRDRPPAESCRWWGVLAVERVLLLAPFQEVLDSHGVAPDEALRWEPMELLLPWRDSGVGVEPPLEHLPEIDKPVDRGANAGDVVSRLAEAEVALRFADWLLDQPSASGEV